ncbi:hypothetical protein CEUSTIGMA_g6725.t1 [Chlamydomonas eustigma]|uniref:Uncharacterized protein n=1 Tax=Chlamydomonas eustigma TaxID=1157962 RepID=A0A250X892_9CHLO|nr:hypothetical protein CEUSTIGMA_g6725.t1 [Chlamydomonas eustigma]|eukprot:GAX79285.1 hypothetical protein CEUSTIGMA_g6725.t1 [Chlamydomonas eustigma]
MGRDKRRHSASLHENSCTSSYFPSVRLGMDAAVALWASASDRQEESHVDDQSLDEAEVEGKALLKLARFAWVASGEPPTAAANLARTLVFNAENRCGAPCLTLNPFREIFTGMAKCRAAACASAWHLNRAQEAMRAGKLGEAATAYAAAARLASTGLSAEGPAAAAHGGVGPYSACGSGAIEAEAVQRAASEEAKAVQSESSWQGTRTKGECDISLKVAPLAPRCLMQARLRLASLLALDPCDQKDIEVVETLLRSIIDLAEALNQDSSDSVIYSPDLEDNLILCSTPDAGVKQNDEGMSSRPSSSTLTAEWGDSSTPHQNNSSSGKACQGPASVTPHFQILSQEALVKLAQKKLGMLLCQEGRDLEAVAPLKKLGCLYRLAAGVLHYPDAAHSIPDLSQQHPLPLSAAAASRQHFGSPALPDASHFGSPALPDASHFGSPALPDASHLVQAVDAALPPQVVDLMQAAFSTSSPFWLEHGYNQDSPYFSYVHSLGGGGPPKSAMDQVINVIWRAASSCFPAASEAKYAEWWAHCRPHGSGHQMHFDSDNEGLGEVRNPIISTVLYLTSGGIGGPTLVTDQTFSGQQLAERGWMVHPNRGRLTMFDGSVLHGVIPGRGPSPKAGEKRITFMVAFWRDIRVRARRDGLPGSSQPYPYTCRSPYGGQQKGDMGESTVGSVKIELSHKSEDPRGQMEAPGTSSTTPLRKFEDGPGPDCFGLSMKPVWKHTWQHAFCELLPSEFPEMCPHVSVDPIPVQPIWQDTEYQKNVSLRRSLRALEGLPKYGLCFQGF